MSSPDRPSDNDVPALRSISDAAAQAIFGASVALHFSVPLLLPGAWRPLLLVFYYLPVVACGALMAPHVRTLEQLPARSCLIASAICFGLVSWDVPPLGIERFLWPQAIPGVAGVASLSLALSSACRGGGFYAPVVRARIAFVAPLQVLGAASLEIYVAHTMAGAGVRILLSQLGATSIGVHLLAGTLAGIIFPVVLLRVTTAFNIPYVFTLRKPSPKQARIWGQERRL